ncbi:MAG: hypothetical protein KDB14_28180 [Planctomycetales bacterium]|nr:hypothetical protein [Planctomycetales bacterium]
MSLFENNEYRWRETCFVMVDSQTRPSLRQVCEQLGVTFDLGQSTANEQGQLETLTIFSPNDFSAMDICFVGGDEVEEQMDELLSDLRRGLAEPAELERLDAVARCDARLDVLHFERVMEPLEEDEFLDPGSLLLVLKQLAELCDGVGVDPQSGTIL